MKYAKHIWLLACAAFLGMSFLQGQDIHYSQFYNMPLVQNPSLTGHIEGHYRVKAIYRNQWFSITDAGVYATPGLSFDMNFKAKEDSKNSFGAGLSFMSDQTGGGDFTSTWVLGSFAYHIALDNKATQYLSLGVQGGILSRRIDNANLLFADQIDGGSGTISTTTVENFENTNQTGGDLRLGATLSLYPNEKQNFKFGLAYMHLLRPKETFLASTDETFRLPGRFAAFGQASMRTKNPKLRVLPELLFMLQASSLELNFTHNLGYRLTPDLEVLFGAGYRLQDAVPLNVGANYKGFSAMFTYDVNTSALTPATNTIGGVEFSLGYVGSISKEAKPELPCIRMY